jgi:hypothetical protein
LREFCYRDTQHASFAVLGMLRKSAKLDSMRLPLI